MSPHDTTSTKSTTSSNTRTENADAREEKPVNNTKNFEDHQNNDDDNERYIQRPWRRRGSSKLDYDVRIDSKQTMLVSRRRQCIRARNYNHNQNLA